jgi:hypothetical protein
MNRREALEWIGAGFALSLLPSANVLAAGPRTLVRNPYAGIDWSRAKPQKASLHMHTLQSDGYQMVDTVVRAYRRAGYSILALTDHDCFAPNLHVRSKHVAEENASPYPKEPRPKHYPANTTWPWTDYGTSSPEDHGMVGVQANELTYRHHINSFFCDYGVWYKKTGKVAPYGGIVDADGKEVWEDDQIEGVRSHNGLAVLNHPSVPDKTAWWVRQSLDWYAERFRKHPASCLVGMEVTNCAVERRLFEEGLWDQLLARFMPHRPVWGFGTDDMHNLKSARQSHTTFYMEDPTVDQVRQAMLDGAFSFSVSTRKVNYLVEDQNLDRLPELKAITVDEAKGTIALATDACDEVRWISNPASLEPTADYRTSDNPFPNGEVVHVGDTLDYRNTEGIGSYVRAELKREADGQTHRTFTSPFGFARA